MFLEEPKAISIMNTSLSEEKKDAAEDGGIEARGWEDRGDEDMEAFCWGIHFARAILVHLPHEQADKKGKR